MVTKSKSQGVRQIPSTCYQGLTKGVILGFLADDNDENIVQIKVYDNSLTSSSSSPRSLFPSSELHLQLSPPPNLLSYTDGTTSLTGSQIQQACTFIDEHISIQDPSKNTRPGRVSVLILAPRNRPEEAMSIGISYLAGMEEIDKDKQTTEGHEGSEVYDDEYTYSTVHRLLMAFHDDPGSPIPNGDMTPEVNHLDTSEEQFFNLACGLDTDGWRGLQAEWRGVLSFDGMQQLDGVWTSTGRR